jgi:LysM repeat protein
VGRNTAYASLNGAGSPPPRVIAVHLSPTMAELAGVTNHVSQNLFAEALLKSVGRVALGDGSFGGGARAVHYFLECERPFDATGIRIVDGSGLSPLNRITPRSTIHLLDLMTRTDEWETFYASLPEAASPSGGLHSLRNRMGQTPAARNLRAKTGTISNVSSLSGYVRAANGEMLAFSIYANDVPSTFQAKRIEDGIGVRLARFTRPLPPPVSPPEPVTEDEPEVAAEVEETTDTPVEPRDEPEAAPAAAPTPPPAAPRTHRVSSGETLDGIARRYGTSVAELQRLNPGVNPRRLQIGQAITVPD